jgi:hypothetical protein
MEVLAAQGRRVRLIWKRQHNFEIANGEAAGAAASAARAGETTSG